jgi:predicted ATPase/serine/threonine protein kinase
MSIDPLEELFHELVALPRGERDARLERLFPAGGPLRDEIMSLLAARDGRTDFLALPALRASLVPPESLGKYRILGELGRGGAGIVYLAEDPDLARQVAIKVLALAGNRGDQLRGEARTIAAVQHPNVAQVYTIEEATPILADSLGAPEPGPASAALDPTQSAVAFLTMEYVPGETLADRLRVGPMHLEPALDCVRQVAGALESAHRGSILHRDLKPQNIKLTPDGWVKVLDFGLARVLDAAVAPGGASGPRGGTPGYMSPEQLRGEALDTRSDLWALGAVLYECLLGSAAVRGETIDELIEANGEGRVDLGAIPPSVPDRIRDLLSVCLEPDRSRRTITATMARQILEDEQLRMRVGTFLDPARGESAAADPGSGPDSRRGNLPVPLSRFIGRGELLAEMESLLETNRLLTLTGPGGVGKTRTSLQLGSRVAARFPAGIWFVDLSELDSDADLPAAVARSLRLREVRRASADEPLEAMIARSFTSTPGLLILDNCEHVVRPVAALAESLLARAGALSIVATSRQALGIPGEQLIPVAPFALPPADENVPHILASEATTLFLLRARGRSPRFDPSGRDLDLVLDLCRRLDGLPLAIELAASHVGSLSVEEIHRRVLEGRPLSTVAATPASSRHRSIRDLVDWSHRLLSRENRILFRRLSVFRGGWTLADAEKVCAGNGVEAWLVFELLAALIEKSLVIVRDDGAIESSGRARDPGGAVSTRYHFLETIRSFAAGRLAGVEGEAAALEDRFLGHLLALTEVREHEQGPTRSAWVRRIEPDYPNLLHGIELALARGRVDTACVLTGRLGRYWLQTGYWIEGLRWVRRILAARLREGVTVEMRDEIVLLNQAARLASMVGEQASASELVAQALELAERLGDVEPHASTLLTAGVCAWFRTDLDTARACYEQSRILYEQIGDRGGLIVCIANLGAVHSARSEHDAALAFHEEHRRLSRESGDRLSEAKALLNLARTAMILGSVSTSRAHLEEALPLLREHRDLHGVAQAHHHLGDLDLQEGRFDEARVNLLESGRIRMRIGDRSGVGSVLGSIARIEAAAGDPGLAVALFAGILGLHESGSIPALPGHLETMRAALGEAAQRLNPAVAADRAARGRRLDVAGLLDLAAGELPEASG